MFPIERMECDNRKYACSNSNASIPKNSLLILNDDCILHIFSFLSIRNKVRLSAVCTRLSGIAEMTLKKVKKINYYNLANNINFNGLKTYSFAEALYICKKIAKYIEWFQFCPPHGENPNLNIAYVLISSFSGLKHLEFDFEEKILPLTTYVRLMSVFEQLESLSLRKCKITDEIVIKLQNCTKLLKLDLSFNYDITGKGLDTLSNTIMDLNLGFCTEIRSTHLINLCKVTKARKLNITGCDNLNSFALQELSKVDSIEVITFSTGMVTDDLRPIAQIPNLKDMNVVCWDEGGPDVNFYELLVKEKADTLEQFSIVDGYFSDYIKQAIFNFKNLKSISIEFDADDQFLNRLSNGNHNLTHLGIRNCCNISAGALINLIEKKEKIRQIDITGCQHFDSSFILKLAKKLHILQRPTCLELLVNNTHLCPSVMDEPNYIVYKRFLKLCHYSENCGLLDYNIFLYFYC